MKIAYTFNKAFTIVELATIISVIGILAGLTIFGYGNWQESTAKKAVQSDLRMVASAMENAKNFSNGYPNSIPDTYTPSPNVVAEMTTQTAGTFCINGYSKTKASVRMSVTSENKQTVRDYLCVGQPNGSVVGGTVPSTPTGVNIAPRLSGWTLAGTASYNQTTDEVTLGTNGSVLSPKIKVNGVAGIAVNGQFYATAASAHSSIQPNGGWHSGSTYYASDGTTGATNTTGHPGNGCAKAISLNAWSSSSAANCTFALGNNVTYVQIILYSSATGYASSNLKVKDLSFTLY